MRVNYLSDSEFRDSILFSYFRETQEGVMRPDNGQKSDDTANKQNSDKLSESINNRYCELKV